MPSTAAKKVAQPATFSDSSSGTLILNMQTQPIHGWEKPYLDNTAAPLAEAMKFRNACACGWRPSRLTSAIGYNTGVGDGSLATTLTFSGMMAASVANTKPASTSPRAT